MLDHNRRFVAEQMFTMNQSSNPLLDSAAHANFPTGS